MSYPSDPMVLSVICEQAHSHLMIGDKIILLPRNQWNWKIYWHDFSSSAHDTSLMEESWHAGYHAVLKI